MENEQRLSVFENIHVCARQSLNNLDSLSVYQNLWRGLPLCTTLRKLVIQGARNIPYGSWQERLSHPLRTYGISQTGWERYGR
jgi:hypothetical protein